MPAKKPAKTPKKTSKPATGKAAAVKKKAVVGKSKAAPKTAGKPVTKPVKSAARAAVKPAAKPVPKPVIKPMKAVAKGKPKPVAKAAAPAKPVKAPAPVAKPQPAKVAVAVKPAAKPEPRNAAAAAPASKPVAVPRTAAPSTPPTPIRSAVAVKSSVPAVKSKKDSASAQSVDAEDADHNDSLSLLAGPRNVKPYQVKRDEEYMNHAQLEHFRTILQSWKKDLMNEVDRTVLHMKDEAANFPDPNDRATQESEFSLELRTRDRERKLIRKIEEALNRIEDGSYGYCTETGEEIGVKRLEARPVATLCVEAQERRERRERQYGDRDDRYR